MIPCSAATAEPAGAAHVGAAGSGWMSHVRTMSPRNVGVGETPTSATRHASSLAPAVVAPPQSWSTPWKSAARPPPPVKKLFPPATSYVRLPGMLREKPSVPGSLSAIAAPMLTLIGPMPALRLIGSSAARPSSLIPVVSTMVGTGMPSFSGIPTSSTACAL